MKSFPTHLKRFFALFLCLLFVFSAIPVFAAESDESAPEDTLSDYYLCLSTQNYAIRAANRLVAAGDGLYLLADVTLNRSIRFYISNTAGQRWYSAYDTEMTVDETGDLHYNIWFSPSETFSQTGCHIRYDFYEPDAYEVLIDGAPTALTANPYQTAYPAYTLSSVFLTAGSTLSFHKKPSPSQTVSEPTQTETEETTQPEPSESEEEAKTEPAATEPAVQPTQEPIMETLIVSSTGWWRILFTPGERKNGNEYLFNKNGQYDTGDDYSFHAYLEQAPQYYLVFSEPLPLETDADATINGSPALLLTRDESTLTESRYQSAGFFSIKPACQLRYEIYEAVWHNKTATVSYRAIDDDNNKDTTLSTKNLTDRRWYTLAFTDNGDSYRTTVETEDKDFRGWYAVGTFNNWCYSDRGDLLLTDFWKLEEVEEFYSEGEEDSDWREDYEQYRIAITVTEEMLRAGDISFYISNGLDDYRNLSDYITFNAPGTYHILFSETHVYGRGRHYRYTLENPEDALTHLRIGTYEEFVDFAARCSADAAWSVNLTVDLTADIDFSGREVPTVAVFHGNFNGCYHTLRGITLTADGEAGLSLFGLVGRNASIRNLQIENLMLTAPDGVEVGFIGHNYGTVENITVSGQITGNAYVGFVAYNGRSLLEGIDTAPTSSDSYLVGSLSAITSCLTIRGKVNAGGIAGYSIGEILDSTFTGQINTSPFNGSDTVVNIGGIAGVSNGAITGCHNTGSVGCINNGHHVGGIAGLSNGQFYFCTNSGSVCAASYAGGIVGYYGIVNKEESTAPGFLSDSQMQAIWDRFMGENATVGEDGSGEDTQSETIGAHLLTDCKNTGAVCAQNHVGGIGGQMGSVTLQCVRCLSDGQIEATAGYYAGGIVSLLTAGNIQSCLTAGRIRATGTMGGDYVGGIAGSYSGSIHACASSAILEGSDYIGGIAGSADATSYLTSCYTNVRLSYPGSAAFVGSLLGECQFYDPSRSDPYAGRAKYNYYIGDVGGIAGLSDSGCDAPAVALTQEQLATVGSLSPVLAGGFDDTLWIAGQETPSLPLPSACEDLPDADIPAAFGNSEDFRTRYKEQREDFVAFCERVCARTYTILFMEWDEGSGEDGDHQNHDNYQILSSLRLYEGEGIPMYAIPDFKEASKGENGWIYDGKTASYFVSWNLPETVTSSLSLYPDYAEIIRTVADPTGTLLLEGLFRVGTTLNIRYSGSAMTPVLTENGKEIDFSDAAVTYRVGEDAERAVILLVFGAETQTIASEVSGADCVRFKLSSGQYFTVETSTSQQLPTPLLMAISGIGSVLLCAALFLSLRALKKGRK